MKQHSTAVHSLQAVHQCRGTACQGSSVCRQPTVYAAVKLDQAATARVCSAVCFFAAVYFRPLGGWPEQPSWLPDVKPAVLDVTCELPRTFMGSAYIMLPTWDTQGDEICVQLAAAGHCWWRFCAHAS
jgi:hypothetical protein